MANITDKQGERVFYHAHRWITLYDTMAHRGRLVAEGLRDEGWTIEPPAEENDDE